MKDIRSEFPVLEQYTYVNTAASGILYNSLLQWRGMHDLDFLAGGSVFRAKHGQFLEAVKKTVTSFFRAPPGLVVLLPNFSVGLRMVLDTLDKHENILLLENDYPAIKEAVILKGFNVSYVAIDADLEANIIAGIEIHHPRVLLLSLVHYSSGIKIDLERLKAIKNTYPDLIIIADGTQYCGTEVFDFTSSGIDVLLTSGYKWLLGGYGNGFMVFKEGFTGLIRPAIGAITAYFEPGHLDTLTYGSLQFSLQFLQRIGMERIEEQIKSLSVTAKMAFTDLGVLEPAVVQRKHHSSIFNICGDDVMFELLRHHGIVCSQRGNGIRISFHFYNTVEDLNRIVSVLQAHKAS